MKSKILTSGNFKKQYMRITKYICILAAFLGTELTAQNVGINPGGSTPDASSILDLNTGNTYTNPNGKGLLIPNVALTSTAAQNPVTSPATSLLVYNTATASSGSTAVSPGYYYWDGTKWVALGGGTGGLAWSLTGNAGTVAGTNFIGTTDAIDWVIKTSNTERMRVLSGGNVGIATNTPGERLDVRGNITIPNNGSLFILPEVSANTSYTGMMHANGFFADGVPWYGGVGREPGAWAYPYPDLVVSNHTGIRLDAHSNYGGISFYEQLNAAGSAWSSNGAEIARFRDDRWGSSYFASKLAISQSTPPAYNLEITGTFGFGNGTAGSYRSRTESRNDAGQIASQSGFFETASPVNFPTGASSWWHLIDSRHSNNSNNYAMQISGGFFDQDIYYRKTNNNAAQPWSQFLTTNNVKAYSALATQTTINTTAYTDVSGLSITITTTGNCVFIINTTGSLETWAPAGNNASACMVAITQNGTTITEQGVDIITNASWSQIVSNWGINYTTVLAAGTYTFKVRARSYLNIVGSCYAFYAGGAVTTSLPNDGSMTILVVPQ